MSDIIVKMDLEWGSWSCVYVMTLERIIETHNMLTGDQKKDKLNINTLEQNKRLHQIAKGFIGEKIATELKQRTLSFFPGIK